MLFLTVIPPYFYDYDFFLSLKCYKHWQHSPFKKIFWNINKSRWTNTRQYIIRADSSAQAIQLLIQFIFSVLCFFFFIYQLKCSTFCYFYPLNCLIVLTGNGWIPCSIITCIKPRKKILNFYCGLPKWFKLVKLNSKEQCNIVTVTESNDMLHQCNWQRQWQPVFYNETDVSRSRI